MERTHIRFYEVHEEIPPNTYASWGLNRTGTPVSDPVCFMNHELVPDRISALASSKGHPRKDCAWNSIFAAARFDPVRKNTI